MSETDLAADHWEHAAESRWTIAPDADGELTLWDPDGATVERESTAPLPIWRLLERLHEAGELHSELTARWTAGLPTISLVDVDQGPQPGWHVRTSPDIALWQDDRRIAGTREPMPAVVMWALARAEGQGRLDEVMTGQLPAADAPEAEEPTGDADEPYADADSLRRALAAERRRAAEAERRATSYAEEADATRSEVESWKARALRPAGRDPRGPGQALHPDVEPQQPADQGCPDCALMRQEARRLRQMIAALREQADSVPALTRQRDEASAEVESLCRTVNALRRELERRPDPDELRQRLHDTPLHPGQEDGQEDEMNVRSALASAAVVAVIAIAAIAAIVLAG